MGSDSRLAEQIVSLVASGRLGAEDAAPLLRAAHRAGAATPVALTAMACRLPGARTPDELWRQLKARYDAVRPFPARRFDLVGGIDANVAREYAAARSAPQDDPRSWGSWLEDIEQFDPGAFGLGAFEAEFLGPAERLFLQVAHEALEAAGTPVGALRGSRTGVFVGYTPEPPMEYLRLYDAPDERSFISNIPANLAYHLAYLDDFRGPVLTVNTTCSSSLSALHLAKRALERGECDRAVVAGVSLKLFPYWTDAPDYVIQSPRNRCAAFDASADGIVYGEGVVAVVLRRLDDAVDDRDPVRGVVTGAAMNSDGASNGMQAPNPEAQAAVIRSALREAGARADQIGYVEAHGTGTKLGDVVEVDALTRAFREDTQGVGFCRLGSIKSNLGHLGDAAGLAGLMQAVLCLEHGEFPGLARLEEPNPVIGFDRTPFVVSAHGARWPGPADGGPRRAGVSSFGISGTNVHVVLEEAPARAAPRPEDEDRGALPVLLSAGSRRAVWELADAVAAWLESRPGADLADIAHTLGARRAHGTARIGVIAKSTQELADKLGQLLQVRAFERVPDALLEQGVFIADDERAREAGLAGLERFGPTVGEEVRDLVASFIAGDDEPAPIQCIPRAQTLTMPTTPYTDQRIWPGGEGNVRRDVDDLFFDIDWVEQPHVETDEESLGTGSTWVLFARPGQRALFLLAERMRALGLRPELVRVGGRPDEEPQADRTIPELTPEALDALWDGLGAERLGALGGIVHAVTCAPVDDAMKSPEGLDRAQNEGVHSLFHLAQSLIRRKVPGPLRLAVVSSRTERVIPAEEAVPARVTAFGFTRVFSQEFPAVTDIAIDHDLTGTPDEVARDIIGELAATAGTALPLVAYRDGRRYTKVVERQRDEKGREIPVRPGGTYVLAGGTGYLGMQIGHYLSERGAGTIVLLSRNGVPGDRAGDGGTESAPKRTYQQEWIARMEAGGARVVSLLCDLTDPGAVRSVFHRIREEHGPVHGAFMLTKELFHLWIEDLDLGRFRAGIDNRVRGAWLLQQELRLDAPDFLVLVSSISSLSGTKGAGECCAVNQYLDAVGPWFSDEGVPTHTLNLTLVLDESGEFDSRSPIPPIDFTEFRGALDRFFRNGHQLDMVARLDLAEVGYLQPVLRIPFGPGVREEARAAFRRSRGMPASPDGGEPVGGAGPDAGRIRQGLDTVWRKTLGTAAPDETAGFFASGGTSLSALRFVHLIHQELPGLEFDVAELYGNPTLGAQLDYLTAQLETPSPGGAPEPDSMDAILEAVENGTLAPDAAARLLDGRKTGS
ncbi:beta-ketoacyl synthase N-terminal-like domain-containing protein [Streptomyces sp. ML-6]|uniref:beta-ketoacyl synthase N-terminal-like domain-containing protein n=1 Tax=Streptomyces sp. ML-6 TaxID=2982693 RepID=UPI0024C05571|nr:beta-ketoacyl synthase N-terminal-like domain-containing protein [Streptomyces sp. ML-6]MDK0517992.1 KR domain-containing protein [Streptomyces sp. ML-6]